MNFHISITHYYSR